MQAADYTRYQEQKLHGRAALPYNTYLCTIPLDFTHVPLHWHDEMELICIKKGRGVLLADTSRHRVEAGCIAILAPGRLHGLEAVAGCSMEYENIIFSLSMLQPAAEDWCTEAVFAPLHSGESTLPLLLRPGQPFYSEAVACVDALDTACAETAPGYPLLIKSHLYRLLYVLYRAKEQAPAAKQQSTDKLKQVLAYIEQHCARRMAVEELARLCCMSSSHFMRFFKEATGKPFVEYCNDYRLTLAARALAQSNDTVLEIATRAGFDNVSYFNRCFKRKYGLCPTAYRTRAKGAVQTPSAMVQ